jgi:hypothetical protein
MYRKPPTFVRNDLLTAGTYNQMRENAAVLRNALRFEHVNSSGEHNTPLIARTLGTVLCAAGPTYSLQGFNADASLASGHNPSAGKLILTLAGSRGYEKDKGIIQVQNASNNGDVQPCLSWARWASDDKVEIYSNRWAGTLGSTVDGAWDSADNASFFVGVHGRRLPVGTPNDFGPPLQRGDGLRAGSGTTYANQLIQGCADLQVSMDVGHTAGAHDTREIAKYWAHVQWDGADFTVLDEEASPTFDAGGVTFSSPSAGICIGSFTTSLASNNYQVFIDVDYGRLSGSPDDYFIACVPEDEISSADFTVYLYKKFVSSGIEYYDRSNEVDFHVWVFDDH